MTYIQGITDGTGSVLGAATRDYSQIDKIDFMQLLVAQIQNQDPLSPMDNSEFTGQITQFTMLEEMQNQSAKLDENLLMAQSINNTSMLGLVGKSVTVEGNGVSLEGGVATETMIASQGPGTAVIEVTDSSGRVVRTYPQQVQSGLNTVTWNGKLDDGTVAADGDYTVSVKVTNGDVDVPFTTLQTGPVEGLRYVNNVAVVMVGGHEYYVSDIYKVS
ncbi:MAG TPA: flagellar hook capping FlgD N-terminal domain-containing protein [Candidatus Krumholzibacteria bacterium]|nr:flagellar hook capping FlgD N-terminal domain-containing protein [Candidatus Krumholzibacteria bacterium]